MKILELDLRAFGPFDDRRLAFFGSREEETSPGGLCVVYGPNEAGKSSALRAIRDLLYGIPTRSGDDFRHRYPDLRIGARLRFSDGEELAFVRRKAAKNSIYDAEDRETIAAERLRALTDAVPLAFFEQFYGLDHRRLADGSEALLADDGEIGRALLGARLGVASLRPVIDGLESEAADLFTARGKNPRINARLKEWKATQDGIKHAALDPAEWASQARAVREGEAALELLSREIEAARVESNRLLRLRRGLPALARRTGASERLAALSDVAPLAEDFEARLTRARASLEGAMEQQQRAEARIERELAKREKLVPAPHLLAERERIESLHQRVDAYRQAREDLPRRESELALIEADIAEGAVLFGGLLEAGSGGAEASEPMRVLRQAVERSGRVDELSSESARLEERLEKARHEQTEVHAELGRLMRARDAGVSPGEIGPLQEASARAARLGGIDDRIAEQRQDLDKRRDECARLQGGLGLESLDPERLESIAFPEEERIADFARRFADQEQREERLRETLENQREEQRSVAEALTRLRAEGSVPSPRDLAAGRRERDAVWRRLRREVIEADSYRLVPSEVPPEGRPDERPVDRAEEATRRELAERFERTQETADELADRLRIDADRVAQQSSLEARAARVEAHLAELAEERERLVEQREALDQQWRACWRATAVEPQPPQTLGSWRRGLDHLLDRRAQLRELQRSLERERAARDAAVRAIAQALAGLEQAGEAGEAQDAAGAERSPEAVTAGAQVAGSGPAAPPAAAEGFESRLDTWSARAEHRIRVWNEADAAWRRLESDLAAARVRADRADRAVATALQALEAWRTHWQAALAGLDLPPATRPSEARERIEMLRRLLVRLRERDQHEDRVGKIRHNIDVFASDVMELVGRCAPELSGFEARDATLRLNRMLGEALEAETLVRKCDEALEEARDDLQDAKARLEVGEKELARLQDEARVEDLASIDEAVRVWRRVEEARRDRDEATAQLEQIAEGRTIEELEAQSRELDPDALTARIEILEAEIKERESRREEAIADLRSRRDALAAMDASSEVAELSERAHSMLASIRHDVERYVELRLARLILAREIERYRAENQAPLLLRASRIFSGLSRGAYPRIASEETEQDGARLVAEDPAGRRVGVDQLSSGTRDQLFLALRLATLEESLDRSEPMPLIADDILIEFDEARTHATLEVLADLAHRTQILLFSHHRHVADAARDLGTAARVIEL